MISRRIFTLVLVILDTVCLLTVFNVLAWVRGIASPEGLILSTLGIPALFLYIALYLIEGYNIRADMMSLTYTSEHGIALVATMLFTLLVTFVVIPGGYSLQSSRGVIALGYLALIPITFGYRRMLHARVLATRKQRYFLFLGDPASCAQFDLECKQSGLQQRVLYSTFENFPTGKTVDDYASMPQVGSALEYLKEHDGSLDAIILRETSRQLPPAVADRLLEMHFSGVPTYTLELFHQLFWRKIPIYRLNQIWIFQEGFQIAREPVFERLKRVSDIIFALIGLTVATPIIVIAAIFIKLEDGGEVFFRQTRVGRSRHPFQLLKLRSMRNGKLGDDLYTRPGDKRITRIGDFLRKTRLDEVPQLWNVLRGDMSLIGPRAEWSKLVEEYEKKIPCYHFRHLVKPGITGWAQVNFTYGDSLEDTIRKLEYDLYYIRHFSFVIDASIVLKTIHIILFGKAR